jgi:hypothetical protein
VRFLVFTAIKIQVKVFWVVMPCNDAVEYQHLAVDAGSKVL